MSVLECHVLAYQHTHGGKKVLYRNQLSAAGCKLLTSLALHGVADSPGVDFADSGPFSIATSFPQPILMGAAFDDQLITDVATVISIEARAFNNDDRAGLDFWTPNIVCSFR